MLVENKHCYLHTLCSIVLIVFFIYHVRNGVPTRLWIAYVICFFLFIFTFNYTMVCQKEKEMTDTIVNIFFRPIRVTRKRNIPLYACINTIIRPQTVDTFAERFLLYLEKNIC